MLKLRPTRQREDRCGQTRRWRLGAGGSRTLGGWLSLANVHSAETMANLGFDWLCIDLQHGLLDYQDLTVMLPAISTTDVTPLVRVPWNEPYEIMKVLDAGAYGVIVPMINNRAEAEQAVAACRYPPRGQPLLWSHSRRPSRTPQLRRAGQRRDRLHRHDRNRRGH